MINFSEFTVVGIVALLVLRPEEVQGLARTLGRWFAHYQQLQNTWQEKYQNLIAHAELNEREQKAKKADEQYQNDTSLHS